MSAVPTITWSVITEKVKAAQLTRMVEGMPVKVADMIGQSVGVFRKVPSHQCSILSDPKKLLHQAQIAVGPEVLDLAVTPILDKDGSYMGPMPTSVGRDNPLGFDCNAPWHFHLSL